MLTSIMFCFLGLLSVSAIGENSDYIKEKIGENGLVLRIVAEERQSIENGLRFSVELENKLAEPFSYITRRLRESWRGSPLLERPGEKDLPFIFSIYNTLDMSSNLASEYLSNFEILKVELDRRITIEGNSKIELDSIVFSEYVTGYKTGADAKDGNWEMVKESITPGTYIIRVHLWYGVIEDPDTGVKAAFTVYPETFETKVIME